MRALSPFFICALYLDLACNARYNNIGWQGRVKEVVMDNKNAAAREKFKEKYRVLRMRILWCYALFAFAALGFAFTCYYPLMTVISVACFVGFTLVQAAVWHIFKCRVAYVTQVVLSVIKACSSGGAAAFYSATLIFFHSSVQSFTFAVLFSVMLIASVAIALAVEVQSQLSLSRLSEGPDSAAFNEADACLRTTEPSDGEGEGTVAAGESCGKNSGAALCANRKMKVSISVIYALNLIFAVCVFFLMGGAAAPAAWDDIIIPFGIFVVFTVAQACVYAFARRRAWGCLISLLVLACLKFIICFFYELLWDLNNIFFGREDTIARSVFIIAYLVAVAAAFIAEFVCLLVMYRRAARGCRG